MDRITIINRALAAIGCLKIQSEAEPGPAGQEVLLAYDALLDDLLSKYPWHFTKGFAALSRLTEEPPLGWRSAFLLPFDRIALPRAYFDSARSTRPLLRYQLAQPNRVYADSEILFAEYQVLPAPAHWPGYFRALMTLCLSAKYALEIREDERLYQILNREAYGPPEMQGEGGQFKVAADLDAQAMPSQQPADGRNPLTDARVGEYSADDARWGW
jgi:hypothetical protein